MSTPVKLSLDRARAACILAQGLGGGGSLLPVLERTGFIRTLGGVDVYLAARARLPSLHAKDLDALVAGGDAQVSPAVRGCMYLVARKHIPAALRLAETLSRPRDEKDHAKAGIKKGEVAKVADIAHATLVKHGPLTTDALRKAMPAGAVRSLGEVGKKAGVSSPLPAALRDLEFQGKVERAVESGRLDSERYLWRPAAKSPFTGAKLPEDPAALLAIVAEIFFRAAAIGTVRELAAWAGVTQREAQAAIAKLATCEVEVAGESEPRLALEETRARLGDVDSARDVVAFLPFEDNLIALQGGPAFLVDADHHAMPVPTWGGPRGKADTLGETRHMFSRSIVADGKLAGIWEYDPDARTIVTAGFAPLTPRAQTKVDKLATDLTKFINEELLHARSFSLDTDDELRKRATFVREMASGAKRQRTRTKI